MLKHKTLKQQLDQLVRKCGRNLGLARLAAVLLRADGHDYAHAVLGMHESHVYVGRDGSRRYIITAQGLQIALAGVDHRHSRQDVIERLEREMVEIDERDDAATR